MRVVYMPATSPDDPEEFGIMIYGPLGTGERFHHLEQAQVERLMRSCEVALQECKEANDPKPKRLPMSDCHSGMAL
jgi:hypothetical protein